MISVTKIKPQVIAEVKQLRANGLHYRDIAAYLKISTKTVTRIIAGEYDNATNGRKYKKGLKFTESQIGYILENSGVKPCRVIADHLGLSYNIVFRFIKANDLPEPVKPAKVVSFERNGFFDIDHYRPAAI